MPRIIDIVDCIEAFASPGLQEEWDNTGWQLRPASVMNECTGAMLCLDVTPEVIDEAIEAGCNLVISHHPLLFRGLKQISDQAPAQRALMRAIREGIYIYSSHTALDSARRGVSHRLGAMLGLADMRVLSPRRSDPSTGLGIVGEYDSALSEEEFIGLVKKVYRADVVRRSAGKRTFGESGPEADRGVVRVALCSGSGGEFIPAAIGAGADAYVTSDVRYHDFLDYGKDILIVDTGHFESEICTKSIFSAIISEKFPTFALRQSRAELNPVRYV